MMSENSSFSNFMTLQKNITKRRVWLVVLAFVTYILYDVCVFLLSFNQLGIRTKLAISFLGKNGLNPLITAVGSVLLAIEGFRWLSNRQMIDFYESQPFSKNAHFFGVFVNSAVILFLSHLAGTGLGLISAAAFKASSAAVVKDAFFCFAMDITIFLAIFSVSTLAVMLTGNLTVSVFAAIVLLLYEPVFKFALNTCFTYIPAYVGPGIPYNGIFSPVLTVINHTGDIYNIICAAVCLTLAFFLYRIRKNEDAGKAVPYKTVRIIVKIAIVLIASMLTGLMFISDDSDSLRSVVIPVIISAVVVGAVLEAIYNSDVRKAFKGFGCTVLGGFLAIAIIMSCRLDLFGYSRWIPAKEDVASASILTTDNVKVKLSDIDTVNALLKAGEENKDETESMFELTISYQMKNGRKERRKVYIPKSAKNLMKRIVSSDDFKKGYFKVYNDADIEKNLSRVSISYRSFEDGAKERFANSSDIYNDLKAAYIRDIADYDFDTAAYKMEIGEISIIRSDDSKERNYYYVLPVYKSFTNTVKFLKAHDMYVSPGKLTDETGNYGPFYVFPKKISY